MEKKHQRCLPELALYGIGAVFGTMKGGRTVDKCDAYRKI